MIYFTADLHLNHTNILKYQAHTRPFTCIELMNVSIIRNINSICTEKDDLYILGDVLMGPRDKGLYLIEQLNPKLHLIRGNHDTFNTTQECNLFESVHDYKVVKYNKHNIICSHYPMEEWDKCHYGVIHLHGHCHGNLNRILPNRFDIGWDVFNKPISFDEVHSWRKTAKVSHHGETIT